MTNRDTAGGVRAWFAGQRFALVAGATAFLVAIGGTASWAYFTASADATGSLTTQGVTVSQSGFAGMGATYLPSNLSDTGSFTVTNTGAVNGTAVVTIAAPESWASGLPIRVWPTTAAACNATNPPGSALSGTWAAPPALSPTLATGASVTYCVRTTIPDWKTLTSADGSQQANPEISVSLTAAGWVATAASATHRQRTAGMYPLTGTFFDPTKSRWFTVRADADTGFCLDVSGSGGSGAAVIAYGCHSDSNQRWEFLPVSGDVQSLVTIRPRHAMGTRVSYSGANAITANAASSTSQQWYVQRIDTTRSQLVSAATGLCLGLPTSTAANATMVTCDSASARLRFEREPLSFSQSANTLTLRWDTNVSSRKLQYRSCTVLGVCSWVDVTASAISATSVSFSRNTYTPDGTTTFRIVENTLVNPDVYWDGIQLSRSGNTVAAVAGIG